MYLTLKNEETRTDDEDPFPSGGDFYIFYFMNDCYLRMIVLIRLD
jgi:hypothetical protein